MNYANKIQNRSQEVIKIDLFRNLYGANFYENFICKVLSPQVKIKRVNVISKGHSFNLFLFLYYFFKTKTLVNKVLLLNLLTLPFFSFFSKDTIVIIHHIDWSMSKWYSKIYQSICFFFLFSFKTRWKKIVVVSEYWERYLKDRGFKNISVVYNSFETSLYKLTDKGASAFKLEYNLPNLPIIYLGNPQKGKGWEMAFNTLKDLNFQFVVTGTKDGKFIEQQGIKYLNLPHSDYLRLLKYSTCAILLSKFKEGWNRCAHECLLVGTPVIGSGKGGMLELLEKSGQEICTNIADLKGILQKVVTQRDYYVQKGQAFSLHFDEKYFEENWMNLLKSTNYLTLSP